MKNDHRTSEDIERDIVDERAQMSDTINDLQRKFSADAIASDLGAMLRGPGRDLGRTISDAVGRNPAAVVLVGVGLAWLVLGRNRPAPAGTQGQRDTRPAARPAQQTAFQAHPGAFRDEDRSWYADGHMSGDYRLSSAGRVQGRQRKPEGAANGALDAIHGAAATAGGAVSGAAASLGRTASDLTDRLAHGLEDLSDDARARVLSARHAAHEARLSSQALLERGTRAATGFFAEQPLVVGALAVALGAALGGALPHSKLEDDTLGNSSDRLFADAQAVLREERDKAMAAVRMAATDAGNELEGMGADLAAMLPDGKMVADAIVDHAAGAATRVFDRATGDAGPANRGQSRT